MGRSGMVRGIKKKVRGGWGRERRRERAENNHEIP